MDKDLQNNGKIISFDSSAFEKIDYSMEDPDAWSFLEAEKEITSIDKNCEKVKKKDLNPNQF